MVQVDFSNREVLAKVVYYGPGLSGKTTNLSIIHDRAPEQNRGEMVSINTEADRTLYFDFLPMDLGEVAGMKVRLQLFTVPGQVYYNATRKLVLQNVDGVVFVATSDPDLQHENLAAFVNLHENITDIGLDMDRLPLVLQYNKRDLNNAISLTELDRNLNPAGRYPSQTATAIDGAGVFQTLKLITNAVIDNIQQNYASEISRTGTPSRVVALIDAGEEAVAAQQQATYAQLGSNDPSASGAQTAILSQSGPQAVQYDDTATVVAPAIVTNPPAEEAAQPSQSEQRHEHTMAIPDAPTHQTTALEPAEHSYQQDCNDQDFDPTPPTHLNIIDPMDEDDNSFGQMEEVLLDLAGGMQDIEHRQRLVSEELLALKKAIPRLIKKTAISCTLVIVAVQIACHLIW